MSVQTDSFEGNVYAFRCGLAKHANDISTGMWRTLVTPLHDAGAGGTVERKPFYAPMH